MRIINLTENLRFSDKSRLVPTIMMMFFCVLFSAQKKADLIVSNAKMNLSNFGKVAYEKCIWLEEQYPYVKIHNFMIMPNHLHILFEINKINKEEKIKSVSSLIGAYKTVVSKEIHLLGNIDFS